MARKETRKVIPTKKVIGFELIFIDGSVYAPKEEIATQLGCWASAIPGTILDPVKYIASLQARLVELQRRHPGSTAYLACDEFSGVEDLKVMLIEPRTPEEIKAEASEVNAAELARTEKEIKAAEAKLTALKDQAKKLSVGKK